MASSVWAGRVADRTPVWAKFFATRSARLEGPPILCKMGTMSLSRGVKRLERGVDRRPSCSAEVKEIVELRIYAHSGSSLTGIG